MKKETLTFPDYESMWSFKEKTNAINIHIKPRKNKITGMFGPEELEVAMKEFQAVSTSNNSVSEDYPKASNHSKIISRFNYKLTFHKLVLGIKTLF
ncbi:MAG TPA: hypothetical protein VL095_02105 [Flavisolibacter sp.]|nr:hypothetical protein [Flavisolibacter sp.]